MEHLLSVVILPIIDILIAYCH